jgi:hypothetical protein
LALTVDDIDTAYGGIEPALDDVDTLGWNEVFGALFHATVFPTRRGIVARPRRP